MVAITTPTPIRRPAPRPRALHVVEGRAPQTPRVLGALAVGLVVAAMLVAVAYLATSTPTTPGATGSPATLDAHVVSEGETMWSIAQEIAPAGEAATYVERLVAANGGAAIAAGQTLTVPVP